MKFYGFIKGAFTYYVTEKIEILCFFSNDENFEKVFILFYFCNMWSFKVLQNMWTLPSQAKKPNKINFVL